jgi:hypothetical protein
MKIDLDDRGRGETLVLVQGVAETVASIAGFLSRPS